MLFRSAKQTEYPDDFFADTRMSFGDHIEELRTHIVRALVGFGICLVIGFVLDFIGSIPPKYMLLDRVGVTEPLPVGLGLPMLEIIKAPVESAVQNFYDRRAWTIEDKLDPPADEQEKEQRRQERERFAEVRRRAKKGDAAAIRELNKPRTVTITLDVAQLRKALNDPAAEKAEVAIGLHAVEFAQQLNEAQQILGKGMNLTTLSAQEAFVVYFKVSMVCGVVLASPWIFWQIWSFVASGLYPHERGYVYQLLGPSTGLFIAGVLFCTFGVLPGAVRGLLAFNEWINLDPDLRLSEWLGFALILPLVFGVSFQTPLVMLFLNRIGMFSADDFRRHWRFALFFLAVFSAVITPTPDLITMLCLFVPMYALYELGILLVRLFPSESLFSEDEPRPEQPVGV